jgi:hypothetical protein
VVTIEMSVMAKILRERSACLPKACDWRDQLRSRERKQARRVIWAGAPCHALAIKRSRITQRDLRAFASLLPQPKPNELKTDVKVGSVPQQRQCSEAAYLGSRLADNVPSSLRTTTVLGSITPTLPKCTPNKPKIPSGGYQTAKRQPW